MSYSNIKSVSNVTKQYANTASFPTDNLIPGIKAIDSETNIIYYWNGTAWYKINTQEAPVRTFSLEFIGTPPVIEGDSFAINLNTTNVDDSTEVSYNYYYRTSTTSTTPVTGSFEIQSGTSAVGLIIVVPDDNTIERNTEFVLELDNGKDSIVVPIQLKTIVQGVWIKDEQLWTNGESGTWTVPAGVTSISVAALGGGNSAREGSLEDIAGGGGALSWTNNIPVVPGQILSYNASRAGITFNEQQNLNESSFLRNDADLNVYVFAEKGHSSASALDAGMPKGSGGRASVGIGDVTYSGGRGTFGTLDGVRGGSTAGWAGTNTLGTTNYTTGRGGYGTGPFGSDANGAPDYDITPPDNSNNGAIFGGGGGAKNPNRHQGDPTAGWGSGAGGFVRVIYPGDTRQFPNTEANKRTPRTFIMTGPKEIQSGTTFTIEVLIDNLISGIAFDVVVSGSGFTSLTESYTHTTALENNKTIELNFTAPTVTVNTPITFDLVFDTSNIVLSLQATITADTTRVIDFADTTATSVGAVNTFFDSLGYTGSDTASGTWGIENGSLNTTGSAGAYYVGDEVIRATGPFELSFYLRWTGTKTAGSDGIISTIPTPLGSQTGLTISSTQAWIGTNNIVSRLEYSGDYLLGDDRWHRYSILRDSANDIKLYRDGQLFSTGDKFSGSVQLLPFEIGNRYVNYGAPFLRFSNYSISNIRFDSEKLLSAYGTAPVIPADWTVSVTNSGNAYIFSGRVGSTNYNNSNQPTITVNQGDIIQFNINSSTSSGHPFYIKTQQSTGTGNQAPGVTGNGTRIVRFDTAVAGPGTYGYQCSIHFGMWNTITVV